MLSPVFVIVTSLILSGCETFGYYAQSVDGHLRIMNAREPIAELIEDEETPEALRHRLELVQEIRDFASSQLGLPDNGSDRSYVDIDRSYVVWSVVATPELSLEPKIWCFPFAGCVSYRGYFSRGDAKAFGSRLEEEGYDVYVGGVVAYSTLGWFDDPVPSNVLNWPEFRLAGLIFHELAHQVVYVQDDSAFNEAFAVTVQQEGVRRWLAAQGAREMLETYRHSAHEQKAFLALVFDFREQLQALYASSLEDEEKRQGKTRIFEQMRSDYQGLRAQSELEGRYDQWFGAGLNNARIASVVTYYDLLPGFRAILDRNGGNLKAFFAEVETLADQPKPMRRKVLARISHRPP